MIETVEGRCAYIHDQRKGDYLLVEVPGGDRTYDWHHDFLPKFADPSTGQVPEGLREHLEALRDAPGTLELLYGTALIAEVRRDVIAREIEAFPEAALARRLSSISDLARAAVERPDPEGGLQQLYTAWKQLRAVLTQIVEIVHEGGFRP